MHFATILVVENVKDLGVKLMLNFNSYTDKHEY